MSAYSYQPVAASETRLLRLNPAAHYHDQLIGSIIHTSLQIDTHNYEALSYAWNDSSSSWTSTYDWSPPKIMFAFWPLSLSDLEEIPEKSLDDDGFSIKPPLGEILCDGQPVAIGAELSDALRRLRLRGEHRTIWIDALCINQEDIIERNSQVRNMSEIYSKADQVLIWVGEHFAGGPASQHLLNFILELQELITIVMDEHGIYNREAIENHLVYDNITYNVRWMFLRELLSRAWFVS
jgi:Heterokaryon incompatibility protein (HET)